MSLRPLHLLTALAFCKTGLLAQLGIGLQGGPLFFQGAWEAKQELTNTNGWTAGLQFIEGHSGERGFRVGLDAGQHKYNIQAKSPDDGIREEFSSVSTLMWMSFEMRFPLSTKHRIFFDVGPVIGVELLEERNGVRYHEGQDYLGNAWTTDRVEASERESGFAIRDGHWRLGVSAELPIGGRWLATGNAYVCPGVGSWALGHGYATLDSSVRAGFAYVLPGKKKFR